MTSVRAFTITLAALTLPPVTLCPIVRHGIDRIAAGDEVPRWALMAMAASNTYTRYVMWLMFTLPVVAVAVAAIHSRKTTRTAASRHDGLGGWLALALVGEAAPF